MTEEPTADEVAEADAPADDNRPSTGQERPVEGRSSDGDAAAVEQDLDALVDDLRRERDEYLDLAQRARADFENYRKRAAREGQEALARGKAELGKAVLPALDSLERALGMEGDGLSEGLGLVHRELEGALAAVGIEAIDPTGEAFDPNVHEALSSRPAVDGEQAGVVAETVQRGYRLGETLLRPARVVVTGDGA